MESQEEMRPVSSRAEVDFIIVVVEVDCERCGEGRGEAVAADIARRVRRGTVLGRILWWVWCRAVGVFELRSVVFSSSM